MISLIPHIKKTVTHNLCTLGCRLNLSCAGREDEGGGAVQVGGDPAAGGH